METNQKIVSNTVTSLCELKLKEGDETRNCETSKKQENRETNEDHQSDETENCKTSENQENRGTNKSQTAPPRTTAWLQGEELKDEVVKMYQGIVTLTRKYDKLRDMRMVCLYFQMKRTFNLRRTRFESSLRVRGKTNEILKLKPQKFKIKTRGKPIKNKNKNSK